MLADVELIEQGIAIEERVAKDAAEQRSAGRPPRALPGEGTTATDVTRAAEKAAFTDYIKYGISTGGLGAIAIKRFGVKNAVHNDPAPASFSSCLASLG